ncbi:hypothetical protein GCM10009066_26050 [Halarchaeum salinum]|uniref:Alcohol dehydrogenase-like N-terminal domain-containing protein n=1 Tax=Halarchaeum salinum TaxID=489912 RepID=A0AAV3SAS0_9EURY
MRDSPDVRPPKAARSARSRNTNSAPPDSPVMSDTMRAVEVPESGADFDVVEKSVPEPDADEVRISVEACGVCHSDEMTKEGVYPRIEFPRVPGHEVVGHIDAVGDDVDEWSEGERVGVGWHGGHCFTCEACRRGDFINCENAEVTGIDFDCSVECKTASVLEL